MYLNKLKINQSDFYNSNKKIIDKENIIREKIIINRADSILKNHNKKILKRNIIKK